MISGALNKNSNTDIEPITLFQKFNLFINLVENSKQTEINTQKLTINTMYSGDVSMAEELMITQTQNLNFPTTLINPDNHTTVTTKNDSAAAFVACGKQSGILSVAVPESKILLITGDGKSSLEQLVVHDWIFGDDLSDDKGFGTSILEAEECQGFRVGAITHIKPGQKPGLYRGIATLRIMHFSCD